MSIRTLIALLLVSGCTACQTRAQQEPMRRVELPGAPAMHAVRSDHLRSVMLRMDRLRYERMYTALEIEEERLRQAGVLADIAAELAGTADALPDVVGELELEESQRETFRSLADQLYTLAVELQGAASRKDYAALPVVMDKLDQTCNTCHQLFRNPPNRPHAP